MKRPTATICLTYGQSILASLEDEGATARKDAQEAFVDRFSDGARKSFNTAVDRLKKTGQVTEQGNVLEAAGDE